jgi:succinoglycan biosynthesis transport protein ExoP
MDNEAKKPKDEPKKPKKGVDLERMWVLSRWKWLAVLAFTVPFAGATSVVLSLPELYRSTATMLVERQQVPEALVRSTVGSELETPLEITKQKILSRPRLEELIARYNLYADLREHMPADAVLKRLRSDIRLEPTATDRGRSGAIAFAISYTGHSPQTVALVTNTLAGFYMDENQKAREGQASGTSEFLKAQLTAATKRLEEQERRVSEFRKRHLGELPQQAQANLASLEALTTQLRVNSDNQVRATERRETLASQLAGVEFPTPAVGGAPAVIATGPDPAAAHLAELKQQLAAARARYTDAHPTIARLKNEVSEAERELAEAKPEPAGRPAPATPAVKASPATPPSPYVLRLREVLHSTEAELKILKSEEQRLRAGIASYQARVENGPQREREFQDISRDYEATKELQHSLMKRYEEAQLAESMEQGQKGEQFRILEPAAPSASAAVPNRPKLLLMALALSIGTAVGAVVLAETLDTSFRSPDELGVVTGMAVLARIPRIATEADKRRRRLRFRLAATGAVLAVCLVIGASHFIGHDNEGLVRMLDRERG